MLVLFTADSVFLVQPGSQLQLHMHLLLVVAWKMGFRVIKPLKHSVLDVTLHHGVVLHVMMWLLQWATAHVNQLH